MFFIPIMRTKFALLVFGYKIIHLWVLIINKNRNTSIKKK